ncbi:MAG: 4-hydroxy-tetrahydrodipicolinate reductase [Planctomycetes bacterium]|nr:4-hydroxy-tetrahydrodipicolinate reductase [Planctomycetota bacterium]
MSKPVRIAIHGAAGRMGRRLVALAQDDNQLELVAALESSEHPVFSNDAGEVAGVGAIDLRISDEFPDTVETVIDFSVPSAVESIIEKCVASRVGLVEATTGLTNDQLDKITQAAQTIPIVYAPNMSLAVNLTMRLSEIAGEALRGNSAGVDVEIIERHHRFKEDSPSGTALRFGELIAAKMGQTQHVHGREGNLGKRPNDEIAYHAVRTGDNPGEHTIVFGMLGETIELSVKATSRDCYALGALAAAKFVARQEPGLYNMYDVLGL